MHLERVLNINDNEASRYALTRTLLHAGFEVIEADSGFSGLEKAQEKIPSIILLDIKLPDLDGFEVCRRLKSDPRTATIPVLHVTAHALGTESKVRSLEDGADAYLTFPVDRTYLIAMTRSLIRMSRAEGEREDILRDLRGRNGELSGALEELRAEKTMREKFVATLSHDLRNPLATIKLSAEMAKRNLEKPETVGSYVERIISTTNRLDQMIQDLLDASFLHAGHELPLHRTSTDLRKLAQETVDDFSARFASHKFELVAPEAIEGDAWDPRAIRRVLENLLQNAIKYGISGGAITVTLSRSEDFVQIRVHNWGTPISDEAKPHLFNLYSRAPAAHTERGWGVGLALVRGVVTAHSGEIRVESTKDDGTTFILDLPFQAPAAVPGLATESNSDSLERGNREHG